MCERGDTTEVIIDGKSISVDSCIAGKVKFWNTFKDTRLRTLGSCCGHGKYSSTIVIRQMEDVYPVLVMSRKSYIGRTFVVTPTHSLGIDIPRKRKFYKRDEDGYYYIPETIE